jgi:cellulose biosynthesis protein BcsQ
VVVVAVYNKKGGVGKSTGVVNLAYVAAARGYRTLVWDLDPQQSATRMLAGSDREAPPLKAIVGGKRRMLRAIYADIAPGLSLLPGRYSYRKLADRLRSSKQRRLRAAMRRLKSRYDLTFIDTPPSLDLDAEGAVTAAHAVLVPVVPAPAAVATMQEVGRFLASLNIPAERVLVYLSRVQARRRTHQDTAEALSDSGYLLLPAPVSEAAELERAAPPGKPVARKSDANRSAREFRALFAELEPHLRVFAATTRS